jgi:dienelactone hydrolase
MRTAILSLLTLLLAGCLLEPSADDPAELARTWDGAHVVVPTADGPIAGRMAEVAPALAGLPGDTRLPLVIYLHGCAGFHGGNRADARLLARQGYAVIAPDSFARADKPLSCDWRNGRAGLHWGVIFFRLAEAHHALRQARALPWVDTGRIALIGQSEGGFATARFGGNGLAARVIMGWTCALPVPFMNGVAGPADVPVLAVVSRHDRWFQNAVVAGDCGDALAGYADSRSLVLDSTVHHVMRLPEGQAAILQFLAQRLGG